MKKKILTAAIAAALLCGCAPLNDSGDAEETKSADRPEANAVTVTEAGTDSPKEQDADSSEPEKQPDEDKTFRSIDLSASEMYGVKGVGVYGVYEGGSLSDLYGKHVLHSEVVGLFGAPVEFTCENFVSAKIQFNIDRNNMNNVPLKNLILLHYVENEHVYNTVASFTDYESYRVTAVIDEPGVYLLADAYQWYQCWGVDVSGYEPTENTDTDPFGHFENQNNDLYTDSDYGFTMVLPKTCYQFSHVEKYSCQDYEFMTFSRIAPDSGASGGYIWMDISEITPAEPMTLEEFADVFMKTRGTLYGNYEYATVHTFDKVEEITSSDGTKGIRIIGTDKHYSGKELQDPYETWYDIYPHGGAFLEFRSEYIHIDGSSMTGVDRSIVEDTLKTLTFTKD